MKAEQRQMFEAMFKTMDHDEIMEVYSMLSKETKLRRSIKLANNKGLLREGSVVEWYGSRSGSCTGEVIKVKRKKAIVRQTSPHNKSHGSNWDIPMSMLTVVG